MIYIQYGISLLCFKIIEKNSLIQVVCNWVKLLFIIFNPEPVKPEEEYINFSVIRREEEKGENLKLQYLVHSNMFWGGFAGWRQGLNTCKYIRNCLVTMEK